ncbi:hypothetical protein ACHQM5_023035 [Ranunculus cassubicifolius]
MNRCSSSHGNSYGPCSSCGFFQAPTNSFSMFFMDDVHDHGYNPYTSSSSSVDCTLSLGTPSTRQSTSGYNFMDHHHVNHRASTSSTSTGSKKLSWDIFQTKKQPSSSGSKSNNRAGNNTSNGDPLLARRCANCDTTSTPLWRNGPRGPKSLCNACGIRYKKEERRAANSSSTTTTSTNTGSAIMDAHHYMGHHHHINPWSHQGNEFRFIEDNDADSADTAIPFLSWRLNVPVHDYS